MTNIRERIMGFRYSRLPLRMAGSLLALAFASMPAGWQSGDAPSPLERAPSAGEVGHKRSQESRRRLELVSWDPVKCELTWVISNGKKTSGGYEPWQKRIYTVDLDAATMSVAGERRAFDGREAEQTHSLLDMISTYAIESTIWWDVGQGDRLGRAEDQGRVRNNENRSAPGMQPLIIRGWRHGEEDGAPGVKRGFRGLPTNR